MVSLAGSFLVAKPSLQDANFRRTVVLILEHNQQGAFGLVVNRPTSMKELPFPLFVGGPCPLDGLMMLHGHSEWLEEPADEAAKVVAADIFMGDASCLERTTEAAPEGALRFRVFTGYAGWGSGQLEKELTGGDWAVVPAKSQLLFDTPAEELWERLVPPRIPEPSVN